MKIKQLLILATLLMLTGCEEKPFYVARIGNAGSLDGPYIIKEVSVADVLGGGGGFGYGAVNGYPGASADIGRMGVPKHIEGYWAKQNPNARGYVAFYRISADINSELAEKKIRTLQNYYQNFKGSIGRMQVVVQEERIQVIYTQGCYAYRMDCNQKEGSDPNQWVVRSPSDSTDVVVLFDGKGEMSLTPFPDSPYEN
uniref:Lipoprotein n=1 Tax=Marinomonas sp. (strain MWYL1) TaxID=400668 RepID=A6VSN8_MARMS